MLSIHMPKGWVMPMICRYMYSSNSAVAGQFFFWEEGPNLAKRAKSRGYGKFFEIFIPEIAENAPNFKN